MSDTTGNLMLSSDLQGKPENPSAQQVFIYFKATSFTEKGQKEGFELYEGQMYTILVKDSFAKLGNIICKNFNGASQISYNSGQMSTSTLQLRLLTNMETRLTSVSNLCLRYFLIRQSIITEISLINNYDNNKEFPINY